VGQKSINNLVDAGNFVMLDIGQPLHIFDADKISGQIWVRQATDEEKIVLLTGNEVTLCPDDLVIADDNGPLAIAGVKGGKRAEVTAATKRIIIEAANFEPVTIRKTATRLNLRNDSSKRYENEIVPILAAEAMATITKIIFDVNPDAVVGGTTDVYPNPTSPWTVRVDAQNIAALIGTPVAESEIESILTWMGCDVEKKDGLLAVTPPQDRLDITIPEDVADEVGRMLGYEALLAKLPPNLLETPLPDKSFFYGEKTKNILVTRGYSEALLYSLVAEGVYDIVYPLASDKSALRDTTLTKLKESLISNGRNADILSLETIKIFEVGKVFRADGEKTTLAMGVLQVKKKKGTTSELVLAEDISFLLGTLGISIETEIQVGEFGAMVEIDFDALVATLPTQKNLSVLDFKHLPADKKYQKFSPYPYIVRDIAIFVPESITQSDVQELIKNHSGTLCVKIWLFDVFTKEFPEGKKQSFGFRLVFQSFEKTLEDKEVNEVMEGIYTAIAENVDWQIR